MDPSAALRLIRSLMTDLTVLVDEHEEGAGEKTDELVDQLSELIDAFGGLDAWLSSGGFLPDDWKKDRAKERRVM